MNYRILGPLEVFDEGRSVDIGPKQQRSLLGLLLLNANRVVSTERILEELWGDEARGKEKTLWVYISRLRSALDPGRGTRSEGEVLVTRDHGYCLLVDEEDVDAQRFESAVESGSRMLLDDPVAASQMISSGLDLWRGSALEDFAFDDFAQTEITRLEELRLFAVENRIDADFRAGRHREIAGELNAFVEANPYRERPVALLMKALYRSGRQADALRAFERYRRAVGDELGIDPSPELQRLEEQVLLHDLRLEGVRQTQPSEETRVEAKNPFQGLHAFSEADTTLFFGRDRLVSDLVRRLNRGDRLLCLVGASGSGKSSVLSAGLVPAVRKGAVTASGNWLVAEMVPGSRPFTEMEASLLRSTLDSPESLSELLQEGPDSLLRASLRVLPDRKTRLLLIIDQFEELFTLVESEEVRSRFIENLETALDDPHGRIVIVAALRADFYQRPLSYPRFGEILGNGVVNTVPLTPDELEVAAAEPAALAGVRLEPSLLARLLSDVAGQSGGLPLFEYTLTELYDRRVDGFLTTDAYKELGGVEGAITRRAEELYQDLDQMEKDAATQLFLRLVTIAESDAWTRRRVRASEIVALDVDVIALQTVLDRYGSHRLLTFDRDAASGSPTVEVAHEALLHEWARLKTWIEEGRGDVINHARLTAALEEWETSDNNADYLLTGERLDHYEQWARDSTLHLGLGEQNFIDASVAHRDQQRLAEDERTARESRLGRQARQRLWGLAAVVAFLLAASGGVLIFSLAAATPRIALVHRSAGDVGMNDLIIKGFAAAEREYDFQGEHVVPLVDPEGDLRHLAETGTELIIVSPDFDIFVEPVAAEFPNVRFVGLDPFALHAPYENVTEVLFAVEENAFLAGAAAALKTETGVVGFIGAIPVPSTEAARVGFEQGVAFENANVRVVSRYIGPVENPFATADTQIDMARELAAEIYAEDADIIFHVAGSAGSGVLDKAVELSSEARHLWVIGSNVDQFLSVSSVEGAHVLSSATKRYDTAVSAIIAAFLDETLTAGKSILGLDDKGLDLSRSGGHLADVSGPLANLEGEVEFGHVIVTRYPATGPGWQLSPDVTWQLTISEGQCLTTGGPAIASDRLVGVAPGDVVVFEYVNQLSNIAGLAVRTVPVGTSLAQLDDESMSGLPTSFVAILGATRVAPGGTTRLAMVMPSAPVVPNCFVDSPDVLPGDFAPMILQPFT